MALDFLILAIYNEFSMDFKDYKDKMLPIGLLIILLLLVGGFFQASDRTPDISKLRARVPKGVMDSLRKPETSVMNMAMNDNTSLRASLEDVSGGESTGVAYVLRKNGSLYHAVEAMLPMPEEGMVYEGWLVNPTTDDYFSTGVMQESDSGKYTLSYMSQRDSEGYDFVVITLETIVDDTPELHVLEGTAM